MGKEDEEGNVEMTKRNKHPTLDPHSPPEVQETFKNTDAFNSGK